MKRKRLMLYSIVVLVTLTIFSAPESAKSIKPNQVAAVTSQACPQETVTKSSELYDLLNNSVSFQAKRTPYGGTSTGAMWSCVGKKDCGDLKKSGKCAAGTTKCGTGSDKKYGCTCIEKR